MVIVVDVVVLVMVNVVMLMMVVVIVIVVVVLHNVDVDGDGGSDCGMVIKVKCCPFLATDSGWCAHFCKSYDDEDFVGLIQ